MDEIPDDWASYPVQERVAEISSPSENCINVVEFYHDRDVVEASENLKNKEVSLLEKGLQKKAAASNTVYPDKLQEMIDKHKERKKEKDKII
jgi:hypothetical protein